MGPHPESFFGVHPHVAEAGNHEVLLPFLERWDSDLILQHSVAYAQVADEGFHIPSGVLHAPGSALTIELQEDSDVFAMLQALNAGRIISKDLLWKDVRAEDRETKGERFILELIDWEANGDPYFYEHHHLSPQPDRGFIAGRRRGVVDLLRHHEVQREEAPGASRMLLPEHRRRASTTCWCGPGPVPTAGCRSREGIRRWTRCSSRTIAPSAGSRSATPVARTCSRSSSSDRTSTPTSR